MNLNKVIEKARSSFFYLKILNLGLTRMIPFNRPHGFRVISISDNDIKTYLPYKNRNLNHIKGLHACALATLCEFTTGLLLIARLGMKNYRIILQKLEIEYLYQGKTDAFAEYTLSEDWIHQNIYDVLKQNDSASVDCPIRIYDSNKNLLAKAIVQWQLKDWSKVRTKL